MTAIGVDYASVDDNAPPDFAAAKAAGARFVIPRRSISGAPFLDPCWVRDAPDIRKAGLKRTAYLFICYPKDGVATPLPEDQAKAFIDYVKLEPFVDYPPMIDVEQESTLDANAMYLWTLRVARTLRSAYGVWPGMYTSARVWAEYLDDHATGELGNCPPWIAKPWPWHVNTPAHLDGAPGYAPTLVPELGTNNYWLYQYQGDAVDFPGFTKTVDISRFHSIGKGATGANVVWLQKRLGITADGIFGAGTENAVKSLQSRYGLAADGIVGPGTFAPVAWSHPAP